MPGQRFRIHVAYEGTAYSGFQRQAQGETTVQGLLEEALEQLTEQAVTVVGASRTDAGVHALGQVCHFEVDTSIPVDKLPLAINSETPRDVVVWHAQRVRPEFHAQHDAVFKRYRYRVWRGRYPSPFWRRYAYHVWYPLDLGVARAASRVLVGHRDFAAFCAAGSTAETTSRTLAVLDICERGPLVEFVFGGDGFLYKMVRNIMGTLLEVAAGRQPASWVRSVLLSKDRTGAGPTAPPQGLILERVFYAGERPGPGESERCEGSMLDTPKALW